MNSYLFVDFLTLEKLFVLPYAAWFSFSFIFNDIKIVIFFRLIAVLYFMSFLEDHNIR